MARDGKGRLETAIDGSRTALAAALTVLTIAGCTTPPTKSAGPAAASASRPAAATAASGAPVGSPPGAGGAVPAAGAAAAGATPPTAAGTRPDNATLKPFREVVAGATEMKGLFPLWQKDDKVWIEIPADRLDQPFFFSYNISDSVGERGAYASQMGRRHMVVFHRVGNAMQLIAKNTRFIAAAGSPTERAVRQSFSDSLIGSAPVLSQPHAENKSVLIDASALLMTDIPGYSTTLETAFRISYTLDRANSSFVRVRADDKSASFSVRDHFSTSRLPGFNPLANPLSPIPPVSPPTTPPDARSVFIGFVYNFAALPEPMRPRYADDRVGYFTTNIADYTGDSAPNARTFLVNRWRLEKKDPSAALSEPKEPIVFWVDRNVPVAYRDTIVEGILVWNKAFEKIGYSNAIVARIQPDDADFDTLDARHASVRWFLGADAGFAIGPSHTDPRTGEILDADIAIPDVFTRNARTLISESLPQPKSHQGTVSDEQAMQCDFAIEAIGEEAFALGLLDARGEVLADSAQADRFARDYLRGVVTHEVGHTLGLRHNFHASTIRTTAQLQDAAYTKANGLTGSVMDYTPFNIATHDEQQGEYVMSGLGPYDYWAIEYAYKTIDAPTAEAERPELARIAARSTDPMLAFATDEDADAGPDGMDPEINRFDLGNDPLAYYRKRFALSRELWDRLQNRTMTSDESYLVVRRNLERGFNEISRAAPLIAKYVGGVRTSRNHVASGGSVGKVAFDSGNALYVPVEAARQKQALDLLATQLFSIDSFRFKPEFISRLGIDYLDRGDPNGSNKTAFYLPGRVLAIQTGALDHLMSDPVARRIGDAENMSNRPRDLLTLTQLYGSLQNAIWSELATGKDITRMRRNLQREHLRRMVGTLLTPRSATLADERSIQRDNAIALKASMQRALAGGRLSPENRSHLRESIATIDDALRANMLRFGA